MIAYSWQGTDPDIVGASTRTISPAEIREAAPSPEWSPNCAMMPKRRRAQSLIVAAEPRSVPAPEAAKPTTSAVMLVENFNMLRKMVSSAAL